MIELIKGNLFQADVEAIVNTVNTVGIMGKGIAFQFKKAYPANFIAYKKACNSNKIRLGMMFIFDLQVSTNPRYIINFPTKQHWRNKSKIEDIESGLISLINEVKRLEIHSIAVPPLGCGLGGLSWKDVYTRMRAAFQEPPEVTWKIYQPL